MRALLLAAGLGTRLRPLTETVPKCLVPINDQPLLAVWLDLLLGSGKIERVLINTSWLSDQVREFIAKSRWHESVDLVHEDELLGTGGTILANSNWLGTGDFFVAHADNLTSFDLGDFMFTHNRRPNGTNVTMMTFQTETPESCGIVEVDDKSCVQAFHEKVRNPPGNLANGAVYIFDQEVLKFMQSLHKSNFDLSLDVLPMFLGKILSYQNKIYHRDIGTLVSLEKANIDFKDK